MSMEHTPTGLSLPESLQQQLHAFRWRVWTIKTVEALGGALFGVVAAYLVLFLLDRFLETPDPVRTGLFLVVVGACALVPVALHRWIWCHRRLEQLARLISRTLPLVGDPLLGIIELVRSESEQARSRGLVQAAIAQVADATGRRDLSVAVPHPRMQFWIWMAGVPACVALLLAVLFPAAAVNAWARLMAPWKDIPRYTFTAVDRLPDRLVVPHGEPVSVVVRLTDATASRPGHGTIQIGTQVPVRGELQDGQYTFALPPQIDASPLALSIGDARQSSRIEPMLRPEITAISARIELPAYLQRPAPVERDVRGGTVSIVTGSRASFQLAANRPLASATVDGVAAGIQEGQLMTAAREITDSGKLVFEWRDEYGLSGREPLSLDLTAREDAAPSVATDELPRQRVILDSETLTFQVRAQDDFGVRVVGLEWLGADKSVVNKLASGEQVLAAGGPDKEVLELSGTFCAKTLGIEPQPLNVRLYVEDYLPGRPRVYSSTYLLYVLNADQHLIWITEQMSKWHRQSLEVRDRELQLHHANLELRMLSPEELDRPENRRRIEAQSAAERANGRRLGSLSNQGDALLQQAMRNPEIGVGHLEKWAEMLQLLKDISSNRMPNVADLLKQSSQAPVAQSSASKPAPGAGQIRDQRTSPGAVGQSPPKPPVPGIVDRESSQQPLASQEEENAKPKNSNSSPQLRLPSTTIAGPGRKSESEDPETPAGERLDEAIVAQQDLLAEFDKIAEELNAVLGNLEGSTLVKRLKAASRMQYVIAGKIGDHIGGTFGLRNKSGGAAKPVLDVIAQQEQQSSLDLSTIMDDIEAYFERRRLVRFKSVLDEMREQDAVGSLRQLGEDVRVETGMSMAQAEFWSDTMDRWADDLVDPASCGKCPGCKSKGSLPPSIVLEAMKILEAEVNLREETRVAERSRGALSAAEFRTRAGGLSEIQDGLSDRVAQLRVRIAEIPDGEVDFAKEIRLLTQVETVMTEAAEILDQPDTGSRAIAAETEAIELLLQSRRINPKGGGGGGSSPGGGGGGTTTDSALALVGTGTNEKEVREDRPVSQVTGETGSALPEEFRAGLDEYFNQLERGSR